MTDSLILLKPRQNCFAFFKQSYKLSQSRCEQVSELSDVITHWTSFCNKISNGCFLSCISVSHNGQEGFWSSSLNTFSSVLLLNYYYYYILLVPGMRSCNSISMELKAWTLTGSHQNGYVIHLKPFCFWQTIIEVIILNIHLLFPINSLLLGQFTSGHSLHDFSWSRLCWFLCLMKVESHFMTLLSRNFENYKRLLSPLVPN